MNIRVEPTSQFSLIKVSGAESTAQEQRRSARLRISRGAPFHCRAAAQSQKRTAVRGALVSARRTRGPRRPCRPRQQRP
jgi:hypothetical protein